MAEPSYIATLARSDPAAARDVILTALRNTKPAGNKVHAAKALGVGKSTFWVVVKSIPGLADAILDEWPDRAKGGGIQSPAHKKKNQKSVAGARAARGGHAKT